MLPNRHVQLGRMKSALQAKGDEDMLRDGADNDARERINPKMTDTCIRWRRRSYEDSVSHSSCRWRSEWRPKVDSESNLTTGGGVRVVPPSLQH